jgi:DNA modification methylase
MNRIHCINCIDGLKDLESESVNCCVTSPPYWGLRDYGVPGQLGLESTPEEYVSNIVEVFREVKRVLRDDGTLWLNLGDTYAGNSKPGGGDPTIKTRNLGGKEYRQKHVPNGLKPKDLVGIPWMIAFALRSDGWYLRQDIIWAKNNPMPESVRDRCTKSHEYIFLFSKSSQYYFNADSISEPVTVSTVKRLSQNIEGQAGSDRVPGKTNGTMKAKAPRYGGKKYTENPEVFNRTKSGNAYDFSPKRNKRSVWTISTQPFKEAHFATFPPKLIEPCILAGCPVGGIVLDPFMGSGTTAMVALQLQRNFIGFELNPGYIEIAEKHRLANVQQRII